MHTCAGGLAVGDVRVAERGWARGDEAVVGGWLEGGWGGWLLNGGEARARACACAQQYVRTYDSTRACVCTYVRAYVRTYVRTRVRAYVCMYVCMYKYMYVRMYACMYVCTHVRMYVFGMYACTHACMYVCM